LPIERYVKVIVVVSGNEKKEVSHFSPIYMVDYYGGFSGLEGRKNWVL
jgi:hypothetical protein